MTGMTQRIGTGSLVSDLIAMTCLPDPLASPTHEDRCKGLDSSTKWCMGGVWLLVSLISGAKNLDPLLQLLHGNLVTNSCNSIMESI